jgi:hypothetical protein
MVVPPFKLMKVSGRFKRKEFQPLKITGMNQPPLNLNNIHKVVEGNN